MNFSVKLMLSAIIAFLGIAYSWIFRSRSVQSNRMHGSDEYIEIGQRPNDSTHW